MSTWEWGLPPSNDEAPVDIVWERLRNRRDALLAASDWRMLPDVPDAERTGWAEYRQALRDLPQHTTDPRAANWPTSPQEDPNG